ncbi:MAG: hypothetical protein M3Y58_00455 [Chloroflexota bacterium]|nr:hypothetical protein [Chloroflexota bacterium]
MHEIDTALRPTAPFDFGQTLAFLDGFPLMRGDTGLRNAGEDALLRAAVKVNGSAASTPEEFQAVARRYRQYQGYWAQYLRAFA